MPTLIKSFETSWKVKTHVPCKLAVFLKLCFRQNLPVFAVSIVLVKLKRKALRFFLFLKVLFPHCQFYVGLHAIPCETMGLFFMTNRVYG